MNRQQRRAAGVTAPEPELTEVEKLEAYARAYGEQAKVAEVTTLKTLEILHAQSPEFSPAHIVGVIAGAIRFYIKNLTEPPFAPRPRDVNAKFFPIINRAAESILGESDAPKGGVTDG